MEQFTTKHSKFNIKETVQAIISIRTYLISAMQMLIPAMHTQIVVIIHINNDYSTQITVIQSYSVKLGLIIICLCCMCQLKIDADIIYCSHIIQTYTEEHCLYDKCSSIIKQKLCDFCLCMWSLHCLLFISCDTSLSTQFNLIIYSFFQSHQSPHPML